VNDTDCSAAHVYAVETEEAMGDRPRALRHAKRGLERMPDDLALMAALARVSADSGLHAEALALYRKLLQRDPGNPSYKTAVKAEEDAMDGVRGRALGIEK
jgi:tetratricopeptide (TPR) repeat protein